MDARHGTERGSMHRGWDSVARDSFVRGAVILALGSLISRGLGVIYRFTLPWFMGGGQQAQVGIGLFGQAYNFYVVLLGISTTGIPSAIAKLLAEKMARGQAREARHLFRLALTMLTVLGLGFTLLLYWAAPYYATFLARDPRAMLSIRAIAPAIFLVSVMSAFRGYFQGRQVMTPYAISQVIEQIIRVSTMLLLASLLLPRGIEWSAAGATFGAVTGAVAGLIYLILAFRRHILDHTGEPIPGPAPAGGKIPIMLREILNLAVPISLVGIIQPLMGMIDAALVPSRLHAAGLGDRATGLFGVLTGFALPFIIAPTIFSFAVGQSLIPSISEAMAGGKREAVHAKNQVGIRFTLMIILPATAGLITLAREIPTLFYDAPETGLSLALLAAGTLFLGLQQTSSAVLHGMGRPQIPMRSLLVGAAVKLVLTWYLTAIPFLNIAGAALATTAAFLVASWVNQRSVEALLGRRVEWVAVGAKPLFSAVVMAVAVRAGFLLLAGLIGIKPATLVAIGVGAAVYPLVLLAVGGVTARDLEVVPGVGHRLGALLLRMRLIRA